MELCMKLGSVYDIHNKAYIVWYVELMTDNIEPED